MNTLDDHERVERHNQTLVFTNTALRYLEDDQPKLALEAALMTIDSGSVAIIAWCIEKLIEAKIAEAGR